MSIEVEYVDHMGSDLNVVNAARVSFGKQKAVLDESDERLIRYLSAHNHWTPFGQVSLSVRVKVPIFVERQIFKHNVGFVYNSISGRYVELANGAWYPDVFREGHPSIKQGSLVGPAAMNGTAQVIYRNAVEKAQQAYETMLGLGICKEQARAVLPLSTYTEFVATGSVAAWARMYNLRSKPDAQRETQEYARQVKNILLEFFPVSFEALTNTPEEG